MTAAGALLLGWLALAPPQGAAPDSLPPPRVSTGVVPATVTVGERFRSFVRIRVPTGARVGVGLVAAGDSLQVVDTVFVRRAGAPGDSTVVAVYPLVAWVAVDTLRQSIPLTVTLATGERRVYRVPLRLPTVRSVLPADTAGLRPRPAKGLLLAPSARSPWWWLLLLVPVLAASALLARRLLRRERPVPRLDPRAEALARLDALGEPGPAPAVEPFYTAVTRVLRVYLARLDDRWGEDLTTEELLSRLADASGLDRAGLGSLLRAADPVKFGAALPEPAAPRRFAADARAWILANPRAPAERMEAA